MKRRSFIQVIAATGFGGIAARKAKDVKEEWQHTEFLECLKRNHKPTSGLGVDELGEPWTKEPRYPIGARKMMPDGRVFRYVHSTKPPSTIVRQGQLLGVEHDKNWIQTKGPCLVATGELYEGSERGLINICED